MSKLKYIHWPIIIIVPFCLELNDDFCYISICIKGLIAFRQAFVFNNVTAIIISKTIKQMQAEASHFEPQLVLFYGVSINYYTNVQTKNRHTFLNTCVIGKCMLYYNNRGRQSQFEIFPAYKIDKKI